MLCKVTGVDFSSLAIAQDRERPIKDKGHTISPSGAERQGAA